MNPEARCKGRYTFFASPTPAAAASTAVTAAECALLLALADGGAASAVGGALHACWQALHRLSVAVGGSASGRDVDSDGGGGDRADLRLAATAALLTSSGAALLAGMAATTADHARTAFTLAWNLRKEGKGLVVTSAKIGSPVACSDMVWSVANLVKDTLDGGVTVAAARAAVARVMQVAPPPLAVAGGQVADGGAAVALEPRHGGLQKLLVDWVAQLWSDAAHADTLPLPHPPVVSDAIRRCADRGSVAAARAGLRTVAGRLSELAALLPAAPAAAPKSALPAAASAPPIDDGDNLSQPALPSPLTLTAVPATALPQPLTPLASPPRRASPTPRAASLSPPRVFPGAATPAPAPTQQAAPRPPPSIPQPAVPVATQLAVEPPFPATPPRHSAAAVSCAASLSPAAPPSPRARPRDGSDATQPVHRSPLRPASPHPRSAGSGGTPVKRAHRPVARVLATSEPVATHLAAVDAVAAMSSVSGVALTGHKRPRGASMGGSGGVGGVGGGNESCLVVRPITPASHVTAAADVPVEGVHTPQRGDSGMGRDSIEDSDGERGSSGAVGMAPAPLEVKAGQVALRALPFMLSDGAVATPARLPPSRLAFATPPPPPPPASSSIHAPAPPPGGPLSDDTSGVAAFSAAKRRRTMMEPEYDGGEAGEGGVAVAAGGAAHYTGDFLSGASTAWPRDLMAVGEGEVTSSSPVVGMIRGEPVTDFSGPQYLDVRHTVACRTDAQVSELLRMNGMKSSGNSAAIRQRATWGAVNGCLPRCPKCCNGYLVWHPATGEGGGGRFACSGAYDKALQRSIPCDFSKGAEELGRRAWRWR